MTGFTKKQVAEIIDREDGVCLMWGSNPFCGYYATVGNHRIGRGMGGQPSLNILVNGSALCGLCNGLAESDPSLARVARVRGVKVRSSHNLQRDIEVLIGTPLLHPIHGPYYLDSEGKRIREVEPK